jgi:hypothetical protein
MHRETDQKLGDRSAKEAQCTPLLIKIVIFSTHGNNSGQKGQISSTDPYISVSLLFRRVRLTAGCYLLKNKPQTMYSSLSSTNTISHDSKHKLLHRWYTLRLYMSHTINHIIRSHRPEVYSFAQVPAAQSQLAPHLPFSFAQVPAAQSQLAPHLPFSLAQVPAAQSQLAPHLPLSKAMAPVE